MKNRIRTEEEKIKHLEQLKRLHESSEHKEHLNRLNSSPEHLEHLKRIHLSMKGRAKPEGAGTPSIPVEVFDTLNNEIRVYPSMKEVARELGVSEGSIRMGFKCKDSVDSAAPTI